MDDAFGAHTRVLLRRAGAADDIDGGPSLRQNVCHGKADAAAAAGDDAGLACKCGKAHDEIFLSVWNKSNCNDKLGKTVKVCIYNDSDWNKTSEEYRIRLRNKEKIEKIDENDVLSKLNDQSKSEFDDLLEIGE